jgi:hypothetical protein
LNLLSNALSPYCLASPSSGQAATSSPLRHTGFLACHSGAALVRANTTSDDANMSKRLVPAETLSDDTQKLFDVLNSEPDFSVVVVSCAYIDACLGSILEKYLLLGSTSLKLLDVRGGALGSFSVRSDACYSLGLVSKGVYQDLVVLCELRNQIAHHYLMLDFSAPPIAKACSSLKYAETLKVGNGELMFKPGQLDEPRNRFVMTVVLLSQWLLLIALGTKRVKSAG